MKRRMRQSRTNRRPNVGEIFRHSARRLLEEYEISRVALVHRGLKGTVREDALGEFLDTHMPPQFRCMTGEIISTTARSKQIDLIVAHATRMPSLYRSGNIQVVPVEAALVAVEVKTKLDDGEMSKAVNNIQSVKALTKTAFYKDEDPLRGLNKNSFMSRAIPGFIFAYDSISMERILRALTRAQRRIARRHWVDGVFVLKKGCIVPDPSRSTYILKADPTSALLSFYLMVWNHLILSRTPPIRLDAYFPGLFVNNRRRGGRH